MSQEVLARAVQRCPGDRLGGVGVEAPLALALERGAALPQVVPPGGAGVVVAPPGLRAPHRLVTHRRVAAHLTAVGPDHGIACARRAGLLLGRPATSSVTPACT